MKRDGIDSFILIGIVCFFFSHLFIGNAFAQSENSKPGKGKLIAGVALMAGGVALGVYGGAHIFDEGELAFFTGIAMFSAGTVLTILGVLDRSKGKKEKTSENSLSDQKLLTKEPVLESQFYLGPTKGGASAGLTLKW